MRLSIHTVGSLERDLSCSFEKSLAWLIGERKKRRGVLEQRGSILKTRDMFVLYVYVFDRGSNSVDSMPIDNFW